ncbi:BTAD domain-containing putative transcriptional regulator [Cohnella sp. 56]|uniref:BTAD domain-containing putative transcriptional regulator n=1 Tax=Cohnella sp. 56 TaxID=3113722 RepID=UPI0030E89034
MKQTLEQRVRAALADNRIEEAVIQLENEALLRRGIAPSLLSALPAERLEASPLLRLAQAEGMLRRGELAEAGARLEGAVSGLAAGSLNEPMLVALSLLAVVHIRTGQPHEAESILRFLLEERAHGGGERMPGEVPWALAIGHSLLLEDEADVLREYREAVAAFDRAGDGERAALALLEALTRHAGELPDAQWSALRMSLGQRAALGRIGAALPHCADAVRACRRGDTAGARAALEACLGRREGLPCPYDRIAGVLELAVAAREGAAPDALARIASALEARGLDREPDIGLRLDWALARLEAAAAWGDAAAAEAMLAEAHALAGFGPIPASGERLAEARRLLDRRFGQAAGDGGAADSGGPGGSAGTADRARGGDHIAAAGPDGGDVSRAGADDCAGRTIKLFGGVRFVREDGTDVPGVRWKRTKTKELLLYLLLSPRRAALREQLVADLFPDADGDKSDNRFYVTSHQLKQVIAGCLGEAQGIVVREGFARLKEGLVPETDAERYERLTDAAVRLWPIDRGAALALYEEAVPLYGALAPELPYADWLLRLRETQLERQGEALRRLGEAAAAAGDAAAAESRMRERIRLQPLLEEAHQDLIAFLCERGKRSEAEDIYRQLERRLGSELGAAPVARTRLLLEG